MKEKKEQNEAFLELHEKLRAEGKTDKEIEAIAIQTFNIGSNGTDPSHNYRAWKSRLASPKKYEGKYADRMKQFQKNSPKPKKSKEPIETNVELSIEAVG